MSVEDRPADFKLFDQNRPGQWSIQSTGNVTALEDSLWTPSGSPTLNTLDLGRAISEGIVLRCFWLTSYRCMNGEALGMSDVAAGAVSTRPSSADTWLSATVRLMGCTS